jgi:hypothetical protein
VASGHGGAVLHTEQAPDVQPLAGAEGPAAVVEPAVQQAVQSAHGGGTPLPESTREQMEQALRADFGGVSVHTDARADALNRQLGARAFTSGQDIFFRRGEYSPSTPAGRHTLAHELTHVVQQQPNAHHSTGGTIQRMVQEHGNVEFENTNPRQRRTRTMQALTEGAGVKLETHTLYLEDKVVARGPDTDLAGWHVGYTQTMYNAARNFYYQRPGGRITRTTETANGLPLLDTSDLDSPFYSLQSLFRSPRNDQKRNMSMTDTPYTRYLPKADLIRTDGRDDFRAWLVAIHQPTGRVLFLHHVDWHVDWSATVDENGELVPSSHSGTTVDAAGDGLGAGRQPILKGTRTLQAVALTPETVVNPMTMAFREKMSSDAAKFPKKSLKKAIEIIKEARSKISTKRLEDEPLLGQARATLDRHLVSVAKMAELVGGGHIVPDDFHETVGLTDTAVEEAKAALREAQIQMLRHGASREVLGAPGQALAELEKWHRKADRS